MISLATKANRLSRAITTVGGFVLAANVLLIIVNIILRRVFNAPIFGSTEYVQYISLIAGSLGLCQNEWYGGNVTMTLVHEKVKKKTAEWLHVISGVISSVGFVYVSFLMTRDIFVKFAKQDVTNSLKMPRWIFVAILAFGIILLTLMIIAKTIILIHAARTGEKIDLRDPDGSIGASDLIE